MNTKEQLEAAIRQAKNLLNEYIALGNPGVFGAMSMRHEIGRAEAALASGDEERMLNSIRILKELR